MGIWIKGQKLKKFRLWYRPVPPVSALLKNPGLYKNPGYLYVWKLKSYELYELLIIPGSQFQFPVPVFPFPSF